MIDALIESQYIMDMETINERYCDSVVSVATETGWSIDYVLELPPWTLTQIIESRERIIKNMERDNTLTNEVKKGKLLS